MRFCLLAGSSIILWAPLGNAQIAAPSSYFCNDEVAGGIAWDPSQKRWKGTTFTPSDKFIVKLVPAGTSPAGLRYDVTITPTGTSKVQECKSGSGLFSGPVYEFGGYFQCETASHHYRFNLTRKRYLSAYLSGYAEGFDDSGGTPNVSGGTCTKIN